jgi:hypothetical protein
MSMSAILGFVLPDFLSALLRELFRSNDRFNLERLVASMPILFFAATIWQQDFFGGASA